MNRIAVIDLGTNTCNLLITEYDRKSYEILWQGKEIVRLGKKGINKNIIRDDAIDRAVLALEKLQIKIKEYKVDNILAFATSAVRDAENKEEFCSHIKVKTGIDLNVISGEKEADLIFQGVLLATDGNPGKSLILDIGGGSNEFILCDKTEIIWRKSFPLGMARIIEQFTMSDPINDKEIFAIRSYFKEELKDLWNVTQRVGLKQLIGCSGAFDTIVDIIDETFPGTKARKTQEVSINQFSEVYNRLINSTLKEREQMKGVESIRIEMIVPAVIFIELICTELSINNILQTDFALREGALYELFN